MARNPKSQSSVEFQSSASGVIAVTPSDTVSITTAPRALWVGGAGNLSVLMSDGTTATLSGVPAGSLLPIQAVRVNATNTTATLIVALI